MLNRSLGERDLSPSLGVLRGGAQAPFSPAAIPGLIAWWAASSIPGLSDGGLIASWPDISGRGHNLTAVAGPIYKTNIKNGWPAARFNESNEYLSSTAFTQAQPVSSFHVHHPSSDAANQMLIGYSGSGTEFHFGRHASGSPWIACPNSDLASSTDADWSVDTCIFNGNSSQIFHNGGTNIYGGAPGSGGITGGLWVGGNSVGGTPMYFYGGDIAEIVVYGVLLTTKQRLAVQSYLGKKYNITIT